MKENLVREAAVKYQAQLIKKAGGFSDQVYVIRHLEREYILKAYHSKDISLRQLQSQLIWMRALKDGGLAVPEVLKTIAGKTVYQQITDNEETYYYVVFSKVNGRIIPYKEWSADFYRIWGRTLGSMHKVASSFDEPDEEFDLPHWSTTSSYLAIHESFDDRMLQRFHEMVDYSSSLPTTNQTFGIIHHDFHHENLLINENHGCPIDFGDVQYNYFFYDLAISIYHALQFVRESERHDFLRFFLVELFKGYEQTFQPVRVLGDWIDQLPFFLEYRRMYSYYYLQLYLSNDKKKILRHKLQEMHGRILDRTPVVSLPRSLREEINEMF
ncbi:phosphotransferase enzyme family protein [Alkalihalobacillus sp. NPDC078783]